MTREEFEASISGGEPAQGLSVPLEALWWDAKGDWTRAHDLVDELESVEGMAVHAYLHRKHGDLDNADYWYRRAGRAWFRPEPQEEWQELAGFLLTGR